MGRVYLTQRTRAPVDERLDLVDPIVVSPATGTRSHSSARTVGTTVLLLGVTSLLMDVSSEMVTATLPLFLTFQLRFTPLQFGLVDGVNQGAAALVRLASGVLADRRGRKRIAATGYGVSALSRFALLALSSSWLGVLFAQLVDRAGKGVRTAPRDGMISTSVPPSILGRAFGVHRAFDTAGAMAGPLLAFVMLSKLPGAYRTVIVVSACFGVASFAVISLLVTEPEAPAAVAAARSDGPSLPSVVADRRFRRILVSGCALSLVTISDAFLSLVVQRQAGFSIGWFPLLFVGTSLSYLVLAVPFGRLADRVGRARVFLAGHLVLVVVYLAVLGPELRPWMLVLLLAAYGAYYAATDGVLMALVAPVLPASSRSSGFGALATGTSLSRFAGSVLFGLLWTAIGSQSAVAVCLVGLVAAWALAFALLRGGPVETVA